MATPVAPDPLASPMTCPAPAVVATWTASASPSARTISGPRASRLVGVPGPTANDVVVNRVKSTIVALPLPAFTTTTACPAVVPCSSASLQAARAARHSKRRGTLAVSRRE